MKILFLSTHFNTGGITKYILTSAKGLVKKRHEVYVATSGGSIVTDLNAMEIEHIAIPIRTKSELNPRIYFALGKLSRLVKEKNIDVIHTHTRVTQVMGALLSRLTGRPHVATCHGFYKLRLSRRLFPCLGQGTIAITEAVRRHLVSDFGLPENKIFLIHSGLDFAEFSSINVDDEKLK